MGNCVPVQKSADPAMKLKCSIHSQGNSIQIESPIKDNTVNGDHAMTEINSMPQSSATMPDESSFRDLSMILSLYCYAHVLSCVYQYMLGKIFKPYPLCICSVIMLFPDFIPIEWCVHIIYIS